MFLLHVLGVAVGCIAVVQKGLVPVLLRQLQGGLPQLVGDLTSLVVLADGIGPGAEDAVDWVLLVPLLLMLHGPVLPAGHAAVLGCDAVDRELEAFSKFSSDMDPITALTIDKGRKNGRLLIQPQYSPMPVEQQIAILYCGTHGLLHDVPLDKVQDFERSFIESLQLNHQEDVLDVLKTGVIDDNVIKAIEETAAMVTKQFI
mgnify:CR=1 FL=1